MKHCPQCNRVETDEALKFCRADGTTLVNDSSSLDQEAGTVRLSSGNVSSEIMTSALPQTTDTNISRATGATTVLPPRPTAGTTGDFSITRLCGPRREGQGIRRTEQGLRELHLVSGLSQGRTAA